MEGNKNQFIELEEFDPDTVNLNELPSTVEQYLRQVVVGRRFTPSVVSSRNGPIVEDIQKEEIKQRDVKAPSEEWMKMKQDDFSFKRTQLEEARKTVQVLNIHWPTTETQWNDFILCHCAPEAQHLVKKFPNHVGTPPALSVVFGLNQVKVNLLIPLLVEWAEEEGLNRPIREWMYALLLVLETPLLHDVVAAIRTLARMCCEIRKTTEDDYTIRELSVFIVIVSRCFGQADLAD